MRTKKNTRSATTAKCSSREAKLAELNRRFHKYERAAQKLREAYNEAFADMDDRFVGIKKCVSVADAMYKLQRKAMEPVKFDMSSGEFFYATEGGKEVFAVKVSRVQSCTFHIAAKDYKEASKIAIERVADYGKHLEDKGLVAEDVSR